MRSTILFVCIGVALLAGTLLTGVFCSPNSSAQSVTAEVVFTPISLDIPAPQFAFMPGTASLPNNFILRCNDFSVEGNARFLVYDVKLDGDKASLNPILDRGKLLHTRSMTSDGRLLITETKVVGYEKGYGRTKTTVTLLNPKTQQQDDVTPSNLYEITTQPTSGPTGEYSRFLWDPACGLVRFVWSTNDWTLKVWAGKEKLAEVGSVPNILTNAQLYVNGRFTYGAVTQDGKLFAFDFTDGKFKQVVDYTPIAQALADVLKTPGSKLKRCTIAKRIAMYGDSQALTIVAVGGKTWSYKTLSALEYSPNGKKRPESEADALSMNQLPELLQKEAASLPPDYISSMSPQIALSEDIIGVVDMHYKRLIVISPK